MKATKHIKIGITIGDIRGIGLEVLSKILEKLQYKYKKTKLILISPLNTNSLDSFLNRKLFNIKYIDNLRDAEIETLNILQSNKIQTNLSYIDIKKAGRIAVESLDNARDLAYKGVIQGIVTLPLDKSAVRLHIPDFIGQTEFFAERTELKPEMIFWQPNISLILTTRHIPIKDVPKHITKERIKKVIENLIKFQKSIRVKDSKIAVLSLNPHSGEKGAFGREEEIINSAIEEMKKKGESDRITIDGPLSSDGFFAHLRRSTYNGIVAMYHDQGLIPMKMLGPSVNITWGLPFIRTSPDHGPAFDIAGKGIADERSMVLAIKMAIRLVKTKKTI
jgi:4-hydroxythreonine-4-phosphate dehydrogenase